MDSVYRGWVDGKGVGWVVGVGWEPKAGSSVHLTGKAAIVCTLKSTNNKQSQFTCQADTVTGSSLTPSVALLVHPSGTAH